MPRPRRNVRLMDPREWYGLSDHKKRAAHQKQIEPCCRMCAAEGRVSPAEVADHVTPVVDRNGVASFERFRLGELQSLCRPHHDSTKRKAQGFGYSGACDITGWPIDPNHPWNRP